MGKMVNVFRIFVGKPEGKRPFERPKCTCKVNIKVCEAMDWIQMNQDEV
jgi:hypothetical protein